MKYKLLATDMDGTLLRDNKRISEENIKALEHISKKGVEIVIATGRSYSTLEKYIDLFTFNCYLITNNGSIVRNKNRKVEKSIYLEPEATTKIINILNSEKAYFHSSDEENIYIQSYRARFLEAKRFLRHEHKSSWSLYKSLIVKMITDKNLKKIDFYKIKDQEIPLNTFFILSEQEYVLSKIKKQLMVIPGVTITSSSSNNIEALSDKASKGAALEYVGEKLKIPQEKMIAVGDQLNDLSMIETAGLGVAVANADGKVLEKADWITKSNEEHGVAYIVKQMF
ncbi:Cof-type HAD-IIB family hydrolase [Isachenkonia alkalipeptolytica]|uniref:HAD family phosphatase n=1 Tax=Isachenkonia alkalipeptolytica TaxID=2565777 RepID=A0AA44BEY8_9CLOT|nr:Cof-type HAD-IIB family hydrolase [Isachenkonia alkalipeptolytica]NBG89502.1 HAD family phosphatase [Isachenkonia alkalipeptolytica]